MAPSTQQYLRQLSITLVASAIVGGFTGYMGVQISLAKSQVHIEQMEKIIQDLQTQHRAHVSDIGHPAMVERVSGIMARVERLERLENGRK